MFEQLYMYGTPGTLGGAGTKIMDLIELLKGSFEIRVILPLVSQLRDKSCCNLVKALGAHPLTLTELPARLEGVVLSICEPHFFVRGDAQKLREKGLKIVWSNEMMYPFDGELEAISSGVVDRVLFVSKSQHEVFRNLIGHQDYMITGNFVSCNRFPYVRRPLRPFTIGRLSRAEPAKFPLDFPLFFERLGLQDAIFRIMAWSDKTQEFFRWHNFDSRWEFLRADQESAPMFLSSLDVFLYPLGHRVRESWGRSTVEAMLTGCVPIVPRGHNFDEFIVHGETGFLCSTYDEFRDSVNALFTDFELLTNVSTSAASHARKRLCDAATHLDIWRRALRF